VRGTHIGYLRASLACVSLPLVVSVGESGDDPPQAKEIKASHHIRVSYSETQHLTYNPHYSRPTYITLPYVT